MINGGWQYIRRDIDETWQHYRGPEWDSAYDVAKEIGESYWEEYPSDPEEFSLRVSVRRGEHCAVKTFMITAEATISFIAEEDEP